MVVEPKVNQYIKVVLISAKRIKNEIFRLFAVSFLEKRGAKKTFYKYEKSRI